MMPVWINLSNNVYTINFAYSEQDIPAYPDLIKVRVCAETGNVIGIEASLYYTNHTSRVIETPKLGIEEAEKKLNDDLVVSTARLAIVPFGNFSEKLCYEFSGEINGETYYVYIDAITGKQIQMFKVIESGEGTLLI